MVVKKAAKKDAVEKKIEKAVEKDMEKRIEHKIKCKVQDCGNGSGGFFYFMGFLGALVYYRGTAPTILDGVIGFFKAVFWPAFLVHGLYTFLVAAA